MSKWQHSDTYCPIPVLGRKVGREWVCRCGRRWRLDKHYYQWEPVLLKGIEG